MKDSRKTSGQITLVDSKPISVPIISAKKIASSSLSLVPVSAAQHGTFDGTNSISKRQVSFRTGMVSRATQTCEAEKRMDLLEKRRLIRKQLAVLLHAVICKVRDELVGNTGREVKSQCPTAFCGLMKTVLDHMKTCNASYYCPYPHCLSSRQILSHWKLCIQTDCPVCSSLREAVSRYFAVNMQNSRCKEEAKRRFEWLITFVGQVHFRLPQQLQRPQQNCEE